jgi:hypothetical protein
MTRLFIIRHAERHKIKTQADVPKVLLTKKGKAHAKQLGVLMRMKLNSDKISIVTSRYERCFQTGTSFSWGYGLINVSMLQKDPNDFLHRVFRYGLRLERRRAYNHIFKHEIYGDTMRLWKRGHYKNILVNPQWLFSAMLQLAELSMTDTMFIFAHDISVSAVGICNGITELYSKKPGFLHGVYTNDHKKGEWKPFVPSENMNLLPKID